MSNLTGLADVFFLEEVRKILEKHSFGSVTYGLRKYIDNVFLLC